MKKTFREIEEIGANREKVKQELERDAINSGELRGNRLEDEFEPFILAEKYMTPKDEQIKETDIPERIQVSYQLEMFDSVLILVCNAYLIHNCFFLSCLKS